MPRKRSPHPGIVRLPARPDKCQRAAIRFKDPDSGKTKTLSIPAELKTEAEIKAWCAEAAQRLYLRKLDLRRGAPRMTGSSLEKAIEDYYSEALIRSTTAEQYEWTTRVFLAWAAGARIRSGDDLTLARLRDFRAFVSRDRSRSPHSVNRDLRTMSAILNHLRKAGKVPRLSSDNIADGLERLRAPLERKPFLEPDQLRRLAWAGLHEPAIEAFLWTLLLTGMRRGEALAMRPEWIRNGSIEIPANATKTAQGRAVDLSVCPTLIDILSKSVPFRLTADAARAARRRLIAAGAPRFTWHMLRRTCGTYLTCAPGIWGAASIYLTARQLGHSVSIAERHYLGRIKISAEAKTLEQAMGLV